MKIVNGDLFNAKESILMHQVNCLGVMGSGVAKTVKEYYPKCEQGYRQFIDEFEDVLGSCYVYNDKEDGKTILNVFGQDKCGNFGVFTDYKALKNGIIEGMNTLHEIGYPMPYNIAIPYLMSCDRGGGDWNEVQDMLEELERTYPVAFTAYDISYSH